MIRARSILLARVNPGAPPETAQYGFMVGEFDCAITYKSYQDGEWVVSRTGRASWDARYIMNGHAILDEFRDENGDTNVDVRVFDAENKHWLVHYTTANPAAGQIHQANEVDGKMVMLSPREANGFAYTERISFEPQGPDSYRWTQEIVYSESSAVVNGELLCKRR